MAGGTGPVTIAQAIVGQTDEIKQGITQVFAEEMKLSDTLPFMDLGGDFKYEYSRVNPDEMPSPTYRAINGEFAVASGNKEELTETWEPLGQLIDIDILIRNNKKLGESQETQQLRYAPQQIAREFNDALFNADNRVVITTDKNGNKLKRPAGMRQRIQNAANFKMDTGVFIDLGTGGTGPDLRRGVATSGDTEKVIQYILDTISWLKPTHLFMNYYYEGSIGSAIRLNKFFDQDVDAYDRTIDTFKGVKIVDPGYNSAVRNTRALTDTSKWVLGWENTAGVVQTTDPGASSRYGSIFFARVDSRAFHGIQPHSFKTTGPDPLPNQTQFRWSCQWGYGFACEGFRDVAEAYNAKLA